MDRRWRCGDGYRSTDAPAGLDRNQRGNAILSGRARGVTCHRPGNVKPRCSRWPLMDTRGVHGKTIGDCLVDDNYPNPQIETHPLIMTRHDHRGGNCPTGWFISVVPQQRGIISTIRSSTDLKNWSVLCTNIVTDGAVHFIDPDAPANDTPGCIPHSSRPLHRVACP